MPQSSLSYYSSSEARPQRRQKLLQYLQGKYFQQKLTYRVFGLLKNKLLLIVFNKLKATILAPVILLTVIDKAIFNDF
jgi:hypothetical protein